ncbi:VWA domain-containing protein [Microlunatus soli]|uniref:VWFA domain-containing protein n=1 Tax=Microlunatus soli TaxID=630515 RepID=A0A1H1UVB7_9ACTN|nr:VWA domain-containing protein [Microlunatus soli]SDS76211.1 hypothetical protein SAMN04489812_2941 [Microlunatus soli]
MVARRSILAVLLFAVTAATLVITAPRAAADDNSAIDNYGGCLVAQHKGDLMLLIDDSKSLQTSDPDDARISAAKYLINQLGQFSSRAKVDLDVQVAGFSTGYHPAGGWDRLDGSGGSKINSTIDGFAERENGYQTDYWSGLDGARSALAAKSKGTDRCQAVVWFSDGNLDLDLRGESDPSDEATTKPYAPDADLTTAGGVQQAERAATRDLCRTGGIADQLRRSEIALFAIGLESADAKAPDFSTMKSIATGSDDCGKISKPTPGLFTLASNIDDLLFAFDKIMDPGREPTEQQTGICQGKVCTEFRHNFVLDDSISTVHILGSAPAGLDVYLVPPKGDPQRFRPSTVGKERKITKAATGSIEWLSDKTMSIDLKRSKSWAGQWAVVFVDPKSKTPDAKSRTSIHISGDIYPALINKDKTTFRSGETIKNVRLGLVDGEQQPIDPGKLLGAVSMDASLRSGDKTVDLGQNLSADRLSKPFTVDLRKLDPGRATLQLRLAVTTAGTTDSRGKKIAGTELAPQQANIPVTISPPLGYPQLGQVADFGSIEGPADATATVQVTGPGCVWLPAADPKIEAGPEGLGATGITADADQAGNCVKVADGKTDQLELQLTTAQGGNGTLDGTVAVKVAPENEPAKARTVQLPFTADLNKPLDTFNFLLALLVALILGPGIPLGLLYLAKYLTAKIPPRALLGQRIDVTVSGAQVLRDGQPVAFRSGDLTDMVRLPVGGARQADAGGFGLATKIGRSPFGPGFVVVDAPGMIGASSTNPEPYGDQRAARLPLAVHNTWALLHNPAGAADQATLLILLGTDASEDQQRRQEYLDDINARAPELLHRLRGNAGQAPSQPDPFAGAGAASGQQPADPFGLDLPAANTGGFDFGGAGQDQAPEQPRRSPEPVEGQESPPQDSGAEQGHGPSTSSGPSDQEDLTFDFSFDPPEDERGPRS